ncbi:major facilitator superfamily domain-containing protein [Mrakia frigida]|uniref:MDR family MFS transporter n=1 Tax=Mrakia frigida TaxID=29902 RepID=UPI003FCC18B6
MTASTDNPIEVEPGSPPPPSALLDPERISPRPEDEPMDKKGMDEPFGVVREEKTRRRDHGARMREEDEGIELPKNKMYLVITALALTTFLAAVDSTIITTALPTISADLKGTGSDYSWVGVSYLLSSSALTPAWGQLSDVVGRKQVYFPSIIVFLIASALAGAATSMPFLIGARALQGIGGGGIMTMTSIILSDCVTLEQRPTYSSAIGGVWALATIVGPLLGGLLVDKASWRWAFFLNLPLGFVALVMLYFCLKLNPRKKITLREFADRFDFVGVLFLTAGSGTLLAGFSLAADRSWSDKTTIALLVVGVVCFSIGMINEGYTKRTPLFPPRLFRTRTTTLTLAITTLHSLGYLSLSFYLPTYYQGVHGRSAMISGLQLLPTITGCSLMTLAVGPLMTRLKVARPFMWIGLGLGTLGFGLMLLLDPNSGLANQEGLPILAGLGLGMLFQPPLIVLQSALPMKDMASTTSAYQLCRSLGSTIGVSIGGTILFSHLRKELPTDLPPSIISTILRGDFAGIVEMEDELMRREVRRVLSDALSQVWIVVCALVGAAFVMSFFLRHYSMSRRYITSPSPTVEEDEVEGELPLSSLPLHTSPVPVDPASVGGQRKDS